MDGWMYGITPTTTTNAGKFMIFYSAYDELGDDVDELADWLKSDGIDLNRLDAENEDDEIEFVWAK
jgi:hypothetical protein